MKVKLALAIVLLTAGCGQSVEESRINLDNLDPSDAEAPTPERVQRHLAETAVFGDFDCVSGNSRCGFDGILYTCGFDGEAHSYFETGSKCDNLDLLEFDGDRRRMVDINVIEQAEAASNSTSTNTTPNSTSNSDFSGNGSGNTSTSNGESRNSGGGGGPQGL